MTARNTELQNKVSKGRGEIPRPIQQKKSEVLSMKAKKGRTFKNIFKYVVLCVMCAALWSCNAFAETYTDVIDEVTNAHKESIYDIKFNAPFTKDISGVREVINPENGALTMTYDLFTLKGMGGETSYAITLVYNNRYASQREERTVYNPTTYAYDNIYADRNAFLQSIQKFGIGWRLDMPYVEIPDARNKTNIYVHMPDGRVFKSGNTESGLEDYKLSDVKFSTTKDNSSGEITEYTLTYANGDIYSFNAKGYLHSKSDKFGNNINFNWSTEDIPLLNSITNNWGDTVTFVYTDSTITAQYKERKYTINQTSTGDGCLISSIKDPQGRVTEFSYTEKNFKFDFFSPQERNQTGTNKYHLLNKVKYSGGLETNYEYIISKKWLYEGGNGFMEYSKLSARYDLNTGRKTSRITYEYNGEPDGFPKYKSGTLPKDYQYFTVEQDSIGTKTIYSYNSKHNQTELKKTAYGRAASKEVRKYDELTNMPKRFETTTYYENGGSKTKYQEVRFDSRGNVIYSDEYNDPDEAGKNVCTYEYSRGTNMCVYESCMKNEDSKVEIRRTLNHGGNSFTSETLYENGRQVKKDEFEYTSNGKLTMSKIQTSKTDYLITKYTYSGKNSFKYPVRVVTSGVRDADGNIESYVTEYEYDDYGNCIKTTDDNKNVVRYTYDSLDRTTKETLEDGKARETVYNDKENTITTTNANGLKLLYFYDKCGKLIKVYDKNANETLLMREYDDKERLVREADVLGTAYVYTYDEYDRNASILVYDKESHIVSEKYIEYDDVYETIDGTFLKMTVSEGGIEDRRITEYLFDSRERLAQKHFVSGEGTRIYRYEYDFSDNMICEISPTGLETKHSYDCFGNVIYTLHPDETEEFFEYDFQGNCIMSENGEGEKVYYTFDSLSRKITTEIPDGERVNVFKTYYDYRGNAVKEINAEGDVVLNTYNERGLLETAQQYSSANEGTQSEYTYDGEGNLTKMSYGAIGGENRISYEFVLDVYGRCIREIDNMGQVTENEYDSLGNLLFQKDRNGIVTRYQYDGLSRNTEKTNDKNGFLQYEYTDFGEVGGITDGTANQKVKYNAFGETTEIIRDKTSDFFEYDDEGRLISKTIEDKDMGTVTNCYTYDKRGNVISIETGMGIEYITYDKAGRIVKKENSQSGIAKTYSYYPTGLVKDVLTWQNDEVVYTESYEYDQNGNKIYEDLNGEIKRYAYDGMSRLRTVTDKNGNITEYEFDDFGNISKEYDISERGIKTKQYYYDANNRLIMSDSKSETAQYEYDNAGNLLEKTTGYGGRIKKTYYRYDGYNRLSEYISGDVVSEYTYNLDGLRESKTVGGKYTRFMYDGMNIIGELCEGNYYIYHRGTELIGYQSYGGKSYYYRQDSHGNVTALLDFAGNEVKNYKYDAYGEPQGTRLNPAGDQTIIYQWKAETERVYNPFGFCGEYADVESGLIYLRARMYDPGTGRFINEDPIRDGLNWYVYCAGNPVMFVDPWGLEYLVVSGSEEDSRYKYNFVETAIKKINDLKSLNDGEWITWIVSKTAYSNEALKAMNDIAYDLGVGFVTIESAAEFQNYVNSQDGSKWELSQSRLNDPITKVVFFSHGVAGSVELGYGQPNKESLSINKKIVGGMFAEAFDSPNTWFYSCNGATGEESSIAKYWHNKAGGFTGAYIGKTTYEFIMYPEDYSSFKKIWSKKMRSIDASIDARRSELGFSKTGSDYYPMPSKGTRLHTWGAAK